MQAAQLCVGMAQMNKTIGELLRPTKKSDSYPKIARRANEWLRQQSESGRRMPIQRMSAEQVRRIFEDHTAKPDSVYLEALAAVQGVDIEKLLHAAGYPLPAEYAKVDPWSMSPDELIRRYWLANRGKMNKDQLAKIILDTLKEEENGPEENV